MAATRTRRAAGILCPRCAKQSIRHNDVGAWCDAFPCRWSITWVKYIQAVKVAKAAGRALGILGN